MNRRVLLGLKGSCSNIQRHLSIGVIGSGPAGFYFTGSVLKMLPNATVDIIEQQPLPFGLVRYGVAPDHAEVKNCVHQFEKIMKTPGRRLNFFGNVTVGRDISIEQLRENYDVIVLACGAQAHRKLNIPGEHLPNSISARSFVGWYNGVPEQADLNPSLDCETAVLVGHGSVALDVSRILLSPLDPLSHTDLTEAALEILSKSKIKRVVIVGNRGLLQTTFTIKVLRGLLKLPGCSPKIDGSGFDVVDIKSRWEQLERPRKRILDLLIKSLENPGPQQEKEWILKFCRSPTELVADSAGNVGAIRLAVNQLEYSNDGHVIAVQTDQSETIDCGLVLSSVGYKTIRLPGVPFDEGNQLISTTDGNHVVDLPGVYACGWCAKGAFGAIGNTQSQAKTCANVVHMDATSGELKSTKHDAREKTEAVLREKGVQWVSWKDWLRIDQAEKQMGKELEKPREKITNVQKIMQMVQQT